MDLEKIKESVIHYFGVDQNDITVHPNGVVDVKGSISNQNVIMDTSLARISDPAPLHFGIVTGTADLGILNLEDLQGAPKVVGGDFNCSMNVLTSFEHGPTMVGGGLNASGMPTLVSLNGFPQSIGMKAKTDTLVDLDWNPNLPLLKIVLCEMNLANARKPLKLNRAPDDLLLAMNRHIGQPTPGARRRAAIACSLELIRAGYKGNARL